MIYPEDFKESNQLWRGGEGVGDLHVYNDGKALYSCWPVPVWQRIKFLFTGKIWLAVRTQKLPPVWVDIEKQF